MTLQWLPFKIDLKSLENYLRDTFQDNFDGIIATEDNFKIIFTTEDQSIQDTINNYLQNLDEQTELLKLSRPKILLERVLSIKDSLLLKDYSEMSVIERKILLNIKLSSLEENIILQD